MCYIQIVKKLSTKWFRKWAENANLNNETLLKAINNLEAGLSSSGLGKHLYKVRIKREHSGKSSGFRTIIVYKENERAIFLYGFGKNEKENIDKVELQYFKKLGNDLLRLTANQLKKYVVQEILFDLEVEK